MAELTGQPADFQSLRGAARVGRLILPNLQLSKFALHYAVTQDLCWTVGAIRELDLHFDFAGGITDPEGIGSVPP